MSVEGEFRERLNAVSLYLRALSDIEKRQLKRKRLFYRVHATLAASRASAFIMIYNCVEFATKDSLNTIRMDAAIKVNTFEELVDHWQAEIITNRFAQKLSNGVNHNSFLEELRKSIPIKPLDLRNSKSLPFSGNINHEKLIDLAKKIGEKRWAPPKASLGGSDLELIRNTRNDLAHGAETFENIGSQYANKDIYDKLVRVRIFMCSYIRMMERYKSKERYRM